MHGVLYELATEAHVVDLNHLVPPGNVPRGAFLIEAAAPDFPPGTVHLAVVDPGVGTARRALAVEAHGQWFVGPDNGLLEWALAAEGARVHALVETRWLRHPHEPDVSRPRRVRAGGRAPRARRAAARVRPGDRAIRCGWRWHTPGSRTAR